MMTMPHDLLIRLRRIWSGSIRRRLIIGISVLLVAVMSVFILDMVSRQDDFLDRQSEEKARALAQTLAANSVSWVLANDLAGLQEVILTVTHYPDLRYAMVLANDGRVLAHTDANLVGRYADDAISRSLAGAPRTAQTLVSDSSLVDIAAPIQENGAPIGWARVGISQDRVNANLHAIARNGVVYAAIAIGLGALLAVFMVRGLTRDLGRLVAATRRIGAGERGVQSGLMRDDELGALSHAFDAMWADLDRATRGLHESEQSYRTLADSAPALIWAAGTDKLCNYFNQPWLKFTGRSLEQEWGNGWAQGVHPDDLAQCLAAYVAAFDRREPFSLEYRLRRHDGEFRWVRDDGCPRYDSNGEFIGYLGYVMDITESKRAEQALLESEAKFRGLAAQSLVGIAIIGQEGFAYINPRLAEIFGYTEDEVMRLTPLDVVAQEDRPLVQEMIRKRLAGEIQRTDYTFKGLRKDGSIVDIEIHGSRMEVGGKPVAIAAMLDITERKRAAQTLAASERLRRGLLDTLTQKVFYKDLNLAFIACNAAFARDLRIEPEALIGKTDYDFFPAELADRYRADDREVMDSGRLKDIEEPYFQDGKEFLVHTVKTPMRDAAGNVTGVLGIFWDVTEQRRAAAALKHSEANLADAQRIAHLGGWELDLVTNVLHWSDEIYRIFEIDPGKFSASYAAFLDTIHPEDRASVDKAYTDSVGNKTPYEIVHRLLMKDGRVKYVHERCETFYGPDGRPLRSIGTVQDITERKRAEEERLARLRFFEGMDRINRSIQGTNDLEQMMRDVLDAALFIFDCDRAWLLYPCDPETQFLRVPMERTRPQFPGAFAMGIDLPLEPAMATAFRTVLEEPGPMCCGPGSTYPLPPIGAEQFGMQSIIQMAVRPKSGKPWLFGLHQCAYPRVWTPEEQRLFQEIGWRLADALTGMLMQRDLQRNEEFLDSIVENIPDMIFVKDAEALRFVRFNKAGEQLLGYPREELLGKNDFDFFPKEEAAFFTAKDREVLGEKRLVDIPEETIKTRVQGERILHTKKIPIVDNEGKPQYLLGISQDITERKQAELALERANRTLRTLSACNEALVRAGNETELLDSICRLIVERGGYRMAWVGFPEQDAAKTVRPVAQSGYEEGYLAASQFSWADTELGRGPTGTAVRTGTIQINQDFLTDPAMAPWREEALKRGYQSSIALPLKSAAGTLGVLTIDAVEPDAFKEAEVGLLRELAEDLAFGISSQRARAALAASEERLQLEIDRMPVAHIVWDADFRATTWNPAAEKIFGYTAAEALGRHPYDLIVPQTAQPQVDAIWSRLLAGDTTAHSINENITKDGRTILCEWNNTPLKRPDGTVLGVMAMTQDITARKQAELALERANRALRTLSHCNEALVRAGDEAELLDAICRLIVETGGYRMAWVGFPEQDAAKTVRPVAQYGHEEGYLATMKISWADNEFGRGPTGTAIRTGTIQINRNFLTAPAMTLWREEALKRGYHSSIALPLQGSAGTLGVLTIYASEPDAFDEAEKILLQELAGDLAFGIATLRMHIERDRIADENLHHSEILRQSLEDSIKAIAGTVEMRDPYTAGHQRRVGELASAIARELGLPEKTIHGIELAASIHDLGKISVPAEILAKPTKLTGIEFMLIKNHAQAGYDILKDIKFPWPIATMVLQHHERLDGSGYPQGLKGDQILLESRIMAVADVVEAMASHRPYRAALGIVLALKEIGRGRGTAYDAAVVDACTRLFAEKRFALTLPS